MRIGGGRKPRSIIVGILALALLVLVPVWFLQRGGWQSFQDVALLYLGVAAPVLLELVRRLLPARRSTSNLADLEQSADALAETVRKQWHTTMIARGLDRLIHAPWRLSELPVTGGPDAALNPPIGQSFKPLAGITTVTREDLQGGDISTLYRMFGGLPSGQLVLLGEAGTGKTAAAVVALTSLIRIRKEIKEAEQRRGFPIPVLLLAQEWPLGVSIEDWLADRLARDYREIIGRDQARELVRLRMVAVIVDGFDEIGVAPSAAAGDTPAVDQLRRQRRALVTALNRCELQFMLVSRPSVLLDTTKGGGGGKPDFIRRALAIELRPTQTDDIRKYLGTTWPHSDVRERAVDRLAEFIERNPDGSLSTVLRIPFYLSLFGDALRPEEIPRLLDDPRAVGADDHWFKDLMLKQVIPNAYGEDHMRPSGDDERNHPSTSDYTEADARRYLQFLARKLETDQSLRWWRVGAWAPGWQRILATTLVGTALGTVVAFLTDVVVGLVGRELPIQAGIGAVVGTVGGLAVGFSSERRAPDSFQHARTSFVGRALDRFNLAVGLGSALWVSIVTGVNVNMRYSFGVSFPVAFLAGLAVLAVVGFSSSGAAAPGGHHQSDSTVKRLRGMFNPMVALAVGLPTGLVNYTIYPWYFAVFSGVMAGLAFGLVDGVTQIQASSAVPDSPGASWNRDIRKAIGVGFGVGFMVAVTQGIGQGIRESKNGDPVQAVVVALSVAVAVTIPMGIALAAAVAEVWRTTLTFVQLRLRGQFPLHGMRFLDNAYRANILRTAGPVYQFRHASLREYLARPDHDDELQR